MTQKETRRKQPVKRSLAGAVRRTPVPVPPAERRKSAPARTSAPERVKAKAPAPSVRAKKSPQGDSTVVYIVSLIIFFFSIFALVSVSSYFLTWREDQSIDFDSFFVLDPLEARNIMGRLGAVMGNLFVGRWFGIFGILVPLLMTIVSLYLFRIKRRHMRKSFVSLLMLMVTGSLAAAHFFPESDGVFGSCLGGGFGYYTTEWMETLLGNFGTGFIIVMLVCLWLVYTTHYSIVFFKMVMSSLSTTASSLGKLMTPSPKAPRRVPVQRPMQARNPNNPANNAPNDKQQRGAVAQNNIREDNMPQNGIGAMSAAATVVGMAETDNDTAPASPVNDNETQKEQFRSVNADGTEQSPSVTTPAPAVEEVKENMTPVMPLTEGTVEPTAVPTSEATTTDDANKPYGGYSYDESKPLSERIDPFAFSAVEHRGVPSHRKITTGRIHDEYGVTIDLDNAVLFTAPIIDESGKLVTSGDKSLNDMSDEEIDELLTLANESSSATMPAKENATEKPAVTIPAKDETFIIEQPTEEEKPEFVVGGQEIDITDILRRDTDSDDASNGDNNGSAHTSDTHNNGFEITKNERDDNNDNHDHVNSSENRNTYGRNGFDDDDEIELIINKRPDTDSDDVPAATSAHTTETTHQPASAQDKQSGFELAVTDNASFVGSAGCFDDDELTLTTNASDTLDDEEIDISVFDPTRELSRYKLPPVELLDNHTRPVTVTEHEIYENKNSIVRTLENFSIKIDRIKATIGPTVTLYEIVPAPGVRISKIKNLEDDIALSLSALGIRIIAPIPGKGTIGIEVPNKDKEVVSMYSAIKSSRFQESDYDLPVVLGRTIQNEDFVIDLTKMPHLLVAGATGQGKSVGLNAIITSLLYKKHPAELKFVLVDPKKVELTLYANLERHFLAKMEGEEEAIITDTQKVVYTLNSLCMEMDARYDLLKKAKVRNIKEYNAKFTSRHLNPNKGHRFMPYFVVIIDEFADLIMTAGREIETPIARLAQLARAVGIHLVIATQRPTTNIITGVIKANFPARIAFRVSSMVDSRTILDQPGANQLIGRGDMLVSTGNEVTRIQCAFIDTPEVEKITEYIGSQQGYPGPYELPEFHPEEGNDRDSDSSSGGGVSSRRDGLFEEVARYVVTNQQGSASTIQRNFSIGFNRAGRIMDQLERAGIVGKQNGSKPRTVLISDIASLEVLLYELDRGPMN